MNRIFDDMEGEFSARLRAHRVTTRTSRTREGEVTLTSRVALVEARFSIAVLDRLHEPSFIGLRRPTLDGETYIIYEVVDVRPMHFQMLGVDIAVPKVIRREFLETIDRSWEGSEETWIDVVAVPTDYRMDLKEGGVTFRRSNLTPLVGSEAHILSRETVREFLCVEGGAEVGVLKGFNLPLTVNIGELVRYHTGFFGFTGCGKSNLASYLIRRVLEGTEEITVVIFDVAGEYLIHLLDLAPYTYSTEDFRGEPRRIMGSQAIPETLEGLLERRHLEMAVEKLLEAGRIRRLSMAQPPKEIPLNLGLILRLIGGIADKGERESIQAHIALNKLNAFMEVGGYEEDTTFEEIAGDPAAKAELSRILTDFSTSIHSMSSTSKDIQAILRALNEERSTGVERKTMPRNPEWLASAVSHGPLSGLIIVYIPEPDIAREAVSRFVDHLLWLKKTQGTGRPVLTVIDEAQEFIPDRTRREDYTEQSNRSVEALLRQGRKYRASCWVCSQRVAHLNVNALQQLHSYFVSVLPRFYDRMVIADAFSLSYDLLDKTTELETGEWLFVSYRATKQRNVPIFLKTPNNEEILASNLSRLIKGPKISIT
ncbi:ATP-binding protein [Candidatus Bathyarchaeota archaeon]|nr:ATP-binding protein [Candidatus Bathyarchaeota archaeon]